MEHLFQAITKAGGYEPLAKAVNQLLPAGARQLTRQAVRQWVARNRPVPAEYCATIEHLYQVPAESLNPGANFQLLRRAWAA
jgi:DNA-binding transcriptional regulator YdaS (Cro superfamily)